MTHEDDFFRGDAEKGEDTPDSPETPVLSESDSEPASPKDNALSAEPEEGGSSEEPVPAPAARLPNSFVEAETNEERGPRSLGIRLRKAGQVFFFPDSEHTVRIGSKVIVELEHGPALGEVVSMAYGVVPSVIGEDGTQIIGRVLGLATAQDIALHTENSILCAEATAFCKSCIRQRKLEMKLVDVEVLHDRSKIIFYFTAPARIDFRELVKDLVRNYRTRIELRQIGVRHETQMIGGIGNCGMVCCCHKYLRKFAPVTIKMAKEQNLFLNPAKLSGMCGRLLCCLSFEQGNYEEFNRRCPKLGKRYTTDNGTVKVLRANMFSQSIAILSEAGEETELTLEEWDGLHPRRAEPPAPDQQRAAALRGATDGPPPRRSRGRRSGPDGNFDAEPQGSEEDALSDAERQQRSRKRRRPPES